MHGAILPMQCIGKMPVVKDSVAFCQKCNVAAFKALCGSPVGNRSPESWCSACGEAGALGRKRCHPSGISPSVRDGGRVRNVSIMKPSAG